MTGAGPLPTEEVGRLFGGSWKEKVQEQDGEQRGSLMPLTPVPSSSKAAPISLCHPQKNKTNRKQSCHSHSPDSAGWSPALTLRLPLPHYCERVDMASLCLSMGRHTQKASRTLPSSFLPSQAASRSYEALPLPATDLPCLLVRGSS